MKFFIVTPSFNHAHFIEETIDSVLSQNVDLEYWVIDGGSTDGTLDILERKKKEHRNFHFLSEPDKGQSDAINKGLKCMNGDMVAYLNSDDMYLPGALELVERYATEFPNYSWFYGRSIIVNEKGKVIQKKFTQVKNWLGKNYAYWKLLSFNIISQPAVFLRRSVIDQHGYFDVKHHLIMDYEYWLRIGRKERAMPVHYNLAAYRMHFQSKSSLDFIPQYFEEFKVSLSYLDYCYWPCAVIHFIHFIAAVSWMKVNLIRKK